MIASLPILPASAQVGPRRYEVSARNDRRVHTFDLVPTRRYLFVVTGTIAVHSGVRDEYDALYCTGRAPTCERGKPLAVLRISDGGRPQSLIEFSGKRLKYEPTNRYAAEITGIEGPLLLWFDDSEFLDNSGSFTITISQYRPIRPLPNPRRSTEPAPFETETLPPLTQEEEQEIFDEALALGRFTMGEKRFDRLGGAAIYVLAVLILAILKRRQYERYMNRWYTPGKTQ